MSGSAPRATPGTPPLAPSRHGRAGARPPGVSTATGSGGDRVGLPRGRMDPVSCPAVPLRSDPALPGVLAPAGAHRAPEGLSELRHVLRPLADPEVIAHLAALRASEPWPPPVLRAGPTVRSPHRGTGDGGVSHVLAVVELCAGPRPDVPCIRVHRGVVACPRCTRRTPAAESRTGPRLPTCACYPALCCHFPPPARVVPR